jgi:flagellar biosynthesis protein FlhB
MAETSGDKSFEPTQHRRQQARDQGQVAFSQDLGSAVLLLVGVLLLMLLGGTIVEFSVGLLRLQLSTVADLTPNHGSVLRQSMGIGLGLAGVLLPIVGLLVLGAALTSVLQVGFLWVPEKLTPDLNRLNPLTGLGRIFSVTGTARLGFGVVKVLIVTCVAAAVLWSRWEEVLRSSQLDIAQLGGFLVDISLNTTLWIGLALLILALFDYGLQRWKFEQDLRMTHQEIREEMKNLQGDPQIAARRRAVQRQMALHRIASSVPKADVVITNPTELAVAIQYDPQEMAAPIVVAKGAGVLAARIRKLALENNIPIVERKPLAQLLYKDVKIGRPIPAGAYAAVAEVLAYVYQLKGKKLPTPRAA